MVVLSLVLAAVVDAATGAARRARAQELSNRLGWESPYARQVTTFARLLSGLRSAADDAEADGRLRPGAFEGTFLPAAMVLAGLDPGDDVPVDRVIAENTLVRGAYRGWVAAGAPPLAMGDLVALRDWQAGTGADPLAIPFPVAMRRAVAWHLALATSAGETLPTEAGLTRLVHRWDDGWTLVELLDGDACRAEGQALGTCVGTYAEALGTRGLALFSLRSPGGHPRVTIEANRPRGRLGTGTYTIRQVKGRANTLPVHRYNRETLRALQVVAPSPVPGVVPGWGMEARALLPGEEIHATRDEDAAITRAYAAIPFDRFPAWQYRGEVPSAPVLEGASRVQAVQVEGEVAPRALITVFLAVVPGTVDGAPRFSTRAGVSVHENLAAPGSGGTRWRTIAEHVFGVPSIDPGYLEGLLGAGGEVPARSARLGETTWGEGPVVVIPRERGASPADTARAYAELVLFVMRTWDEDHRAQWADGP